MPISSIRNAIPIGSLVLGIIIAIVLHLYVPTVGIIEYPITLLGIVIIVLGILLFAWSVSRFIKYKTDIRPAGAPSTLMTSGPYAYSRNPIYSANILVLLGVCVLLGSLLPFIVIPLYITIVSTLVIPFEELRLRETFGNTYKDYQAHVGRWI